MTRPIYGEFPVPRLRRSVLHAGGLVVLACAWALNGGAQSATEAVNSPPQPMRTVDAALPNGDGPDRELPPQGNAESAEAGRELAESAENASARPLPKPTEGEESTEPVEEGEQEETRDTVGITIERRAPTKLSFDLTGKELRILPGAFGDAFRAVGTLPGLTPIFSGLPFYYVRGAPPGNVGYRYDGIQLPTLFHVLIGPSVLQPAFVDSVKLHPGTFGAELGQFSGGFITAQPTPPAFEPRAEASVRIFDAGAFIETPFADGKGTLSIGGRYSYTAAILEQVAEDAVLNYSDYQVRLTYELTPDDRLTVMTLGSYDLFGTDENDVLEVNYGTEFYRLTVIHQHDFAQGSWRSQVTGGYDRTLFGFDNASRVQSLNANTQVDHRLAAELQLRAGIDANVRKFNTVESKYLDPDQIGADFFEQNYPTRTDPSVGLWVESIWDATDRLRITPGGRVDYYQSQGTKLMALEPRLRADYSLTASSGIVAAVGMAYQPPSAGLPIGGLVPAGLDQGLQRTVSSSLGARTVPWPGAQASATLFYNRFGNMTDALAGDAEGGGPDVDLRGRSDGYAVGLEANFTGRISDSLTGLFSYTLSRSVRDINRRRVYSQFDRTHVLNTALNYTFGNGYSMGGRYLAYTGVPFADDNGNASVGTTPVRSDFFQRLDVRFEKQWRPESFERLSFIAEVLNLTGSSEQSAPTTRLPAIVIPSIGLEGAF